MASLPSMGAGPLVRLQCSVHPTAHERHVRKRVVGDVESEVVAGSLEYGQRLLDKPRQPLSRRALRLEVEADVARLDAARTARPRDRLPPRLAG